jgi:error-prone DNA polymerase
VFLTLEDETGIANIVCWKDIFHANRRVVMGASFLVVHGRLQVANNVIHLVAERFTDLSDKLGEMRDHEEAPGAKPPPAHARLDNRLVRSRDFH